MKEDYILIKVTLAEPLAIGLGWYTDDIEGRRFEVVDLPAGSINTQTGAYEYDLRLDAQYYKFKHKLMKFNPAIGARETSWSFTANLQGHLEQILWNLNAYAAPDTPNGFLFNGGKDNWQAKIHHLQDEPITPTESLVKTLSYNSTNVIDAINQLAQAYEMEWWFEQNILYIGKCERGEALEISHSNALISHSTSSERKATRVYAYGSTRNIPGNYRKKLLFNLNSVSYSAKTNSIDFYDFNRKLNPEQHLWPEDKCTQPVAKSNYNGYTSSEQKKIEQYVDVHQGIWLDAKGKKYEFTADNINKLGYFPAGILGIKSIDPINAFNDVKGNDSEEYVKVVEPEINENDVWTKYFIKGEKETILELNLWVRCYKAEYDEVTKTYKQSAEYQDIYTNLNTVNLNNTSQFNSGLTFRSENTTTVQLPYNCHSVAVNPYITAKVVGIKSNEIKDQPVILETSNYKLALQVYSRAVTTCSANDVLKLYPELTIEQLTARSDKSTFNDAEKAKYNEIMEHGLNVVLNPGHLLYDKGYILRASFPTWDNDAQSIANIFEKGKEVGMPFRIEGLFEAAVPWEYFTPKYSLDSNSELALNSVVNKQLLLPEFIPNSDPPMPLNGYIDVAPNGKTITEEEAIEDIVTFEDIYPSTESRITDVLLSPDVYEDQEANGNSSKPIITKWQPYRFKCDTFQTGAWNSKPFAPVYRTEEDLSITFLLPENKDGGDTMVAGSNLLAGMTFRVRHITGTDEFEIIRDDDTKLPNAVLHPSKGDRFAFVNINIIALDKEAILKAENRLYEEAMKYIAKKNIDNSTYTAKLFCDYAKEWFEKDSTAYKCEAPNARSLVGRKVNLVSALYFHDYLANTRQSRILGYEIPLDYPYDNPTFTIGEKGEYSRLGEIEDKIENMGGAAYNVSASNGVSVNNTAGTGSQVAVITSGSNVQPTDENVYSALRSRVEFMLASAVQKVKHLWHFLRGVTIGEYVKGLSGAAITEEGDADMRTAVMRKSLQVGRQFAAGDNGCKIWEDEFGNTRLQVDFAEITKKATFAELEIKKLTHSGGVIILSPASMEVDEVVELPNGDFKVYGKASDPENPAKIISNHFQKYDLARCQTFNVQAGTTANATNRYYWRLVVEAGQETKGQVTRNYIVLSKEDCDPVTKNDAPMAGDSIVMFGNRRNPERQHLVIISSYGSDAPSIRQYQGINTYSLPADKLKTCISPNGNKFCGEFRVEVESGKVQSLDQYISEQGVTYTLIGKCEEKDGKSLFYATPYRIKEGAVEELYMAVGNRSFASIGNFPLLVGNKFVLFLGAEPLVFSLTCECLNKDGSVIFTDTCSNGSLSIGDRKLPVIDIMGDISVKRMAAIRPSEGIESIVKSMPTLSEVENVRFTLFREQGDAKIKLAECMIDGSAKRQSLRSEFTVKANEIKQSVSDLEGKQSELLVRVDGISSTVTGVNGELSSVRQTANEISLRVEQTEKGLASAGIDIGHGEITLQANSVKVQGEDDEPTLIFEADGTINARRVIACDTNGNKIASMNELNDGAYRIYYPKSTNETEDRLRLIFQPAESTGDIIQYKNWAGETIWTLGDEGYKAQTVKQTWYPLKLNWLGPNISQLTSFDGYDEWDCYKVVNTDLSAIYTTTPPDSKPGTPLSPLDNGWYGFAISVNNGQRSRSVAYIEGGKIVINGYFNDASWETEKRNLQDKYTEYSNNK